jgi:HEAT repeat protein
LNNWFLKLTLSGFLFLMLPNRASASTVAPSCPTSVADAIAQLEKISQASGSKYEQAVTNSQHLLAFIFFQGFSKPTTFSLVRQKVDDSSSRLFTKKMLLSIMGYWRNPALLNFVGQKSRDYGQPASLRFSAIMALGAAGYPSVFDDLMAAALSDPDLTNRATALLSLRGIGNADVYDAMLSQMDKIMDKNHFDKAAILPMLGRGPVLTSSQQNQLVNLYVQCLQNFKYQIRMAAAQGLQARGNASVASNLWSAFDSESSYSADPQGPGERVEHKIVKLKILVAIRKINAPGTEQQWLQRFDNEYDQDIVAEMYDMLSGMASIACLQKVKNGILSENEFYVIHASKAAQDLGFSSLLPDLENRLLTVRDVYARTFVREAINALAN